MESLVKMKAVLVKYMC